MQFTPEPESVSTAAYGPTKGMTLMGVWACNLSDLPIEIDSQSIYLAGGSQLGLIGPARAKAAMATRSRNTWPSRAVQGLAIGTAASTIAVTAIASQNPSKTNVKLAGGLGLGVPLLSLISDALKKEIPQMDHSKLLDGRLYFPPKGCLDRFAFGKMGAQAFEIEIAK